MYLILCLKLVNNIGLAKKQYICVGKTEIIKSKTNIKLQLLSTNKTQYNILYIDTFHIKFLSHYTH